MEPIMSKQQLFMTFAVEDEDYDIFYLKNTPPEKIGSLPSSIDVESISAVLNFLELVHLKGEESGKRRGGRTVLDAIKNQCRNLEGVC